MRRLWWTGLAAAAALAALAFAGGASLAGPAFGPFSFFAAGGATAEWTKAVAHEGRFAVKLDNPLPTGNAYAGLWVGGISGTPLSDLQELGFSVTGYIGAGAPRFSLLLDDGTVLWLSALYCDDLDTGSPDWKTVDFVNGACTIYDSAGHTHTSWSDVVAAHSDATVSALFLILDEGPATSYVDDIVIGIEGLRVRYGEPRDNGVPHRLEP